MNTTGKKVLVWSGVFLLAMTTGCPGERSTGGSRGAAVAVYNSIAALLAEGTCGDYYLADIQSDFSYEVDSLTAGDTTGLTIDISLPDPFTTPILQTYEVVITVPSEFTFLGFDALGTNAQIGTWEFEWDNPNGVFDDQNVGYTIDLRAISVGNAYSDSLENDSYDPGIDPTAIHSTGGGGEHIITLNLPNGGVEQGTHGFCSYFSTDIRFTLYDGIVQLPDTPSDYDISITATSVDPDSGDEDDETGTAPSVWSYTYPVTVPEPSSTLMMLISLGLLAGLRRLRSHT